MKTKEVLCQLIALVLFFHVASFRPAKAQILINEVMANPTEGKEKVELIIDPSANVNQLNLENWSLWDELSQPSSLHKFGPVQLIKGQFLVIEINGKLNNDGDSVSLKNLDDEMVSQFSYTQTEKGFSFYRSPTDLDPFSQNFTLGTPSFGQINPFPSPSPNPSLPLAITPVLTTAVTASSVAPPATTHLSTTPTPIALKHIEREPSPGASPPNLNLLKKIQEKISSLENQYAAQKIQLTPPIKLLLEKNRQSFDTQSRSPKAVMFVIIGGLCFVSASYLFYESKKN